MDLRGNPEGLLSPEIGLTGTLVFRSDFGAHQFARNLKWPHQVIGRHRSNE